MGSQRTKISLRAGFDPRPDLQREAVRTGAVWEWQDCPLPGSFNAWKVTWSRGGAGHRYRRTLSGKTPLPAAPIGPALVRELQNAGLSVTPVKPKHDKKIRMSIQSGKFASGRVFFPNQAPWLPDLESELFMFPNGRHDDQVDSISQALAHEMSECIWSERNLAGFARFTSAFGGW